MSSPSSPKAGDSRLLDKLLGVEPRVYAADDDDATIVLPREAMPEDPTPPPVTDSTPSSTELPATEPVEVSTGVVIDQRYRVQRLVGRGGIGLVYLCHHEVLEKPVAMKVLRPEYADQPEVIERFVNEARAASAIKSKHIVNTLDIGSLPSGAPYFIMEHVDAETLASILQKKHALPIAEALEIVRQMADGLGAAHTAGIVHRDLKPENVFIGHESNGAVLVKIFDFGVAKVTRAKSRLTHVGAIFGTPSYMSPEQARGQAVDQRADIYALGVMLFEMLAGQLPFDGEDPLAVMAQHVDAPVPPLKQTLSGEAVPPGVEAVVRRCLEKNRDDRYPSVAELLVDLEDAEHAPSGPHPLPGVEPHTDHDLHPDLLLRDSQLPEIVVPLEDVAVAAVPAPAVSSRPGVTSPRPAAVSPRPPLAVAPRAAAAARTVSVPPEPRRSWPWLLAAALGVIGLGVVFLPTGSVGSMAKSLTNAEAPAKAPAPPPAAAVAAPKKKETEVHLVLSPLDANVFLGERDLGQMPVSVNVEEGKPLVVSVRRKGYKSRRVVLDGTQTRVVVGLKQQGAK